MTIEERAEKNATELVGYNDTLKAGFEAGYTIGATEQDPISRADQKKIDIEKALKHLHNTYELHMMPNFDEDFMKAMEE